MSYQSGFKFLKVYVPNVNINLDTEVYGLFVFSFKNSPNCLKSFKNFIRRGFFNSYDTLVKVTFIASWGPNPEAILIP